MGVVGDDRGFREGDFAGDETWGVLAVVSDGSIDPFDLGVARESELRSVGDPDGKVKEATEAIFGGEVVLGVHEPIVVQDERFAPQYRPLSQRKQ